MLFCVKETRRKENTREQLRAVKTAVTIETIETDEAIETIVTICTREHLGCLFTHL